VILFPNLAQHVPCSRRHFRQIRAMDPMLHAKTGRGIGAMMLLEPAICAAVVICVLSTLIAAD